MEIEIEAEAPSPVCWQPLEHSLIELLHKESASDLLVSKTAT
jgi:hypothetical protein